MFHQPLSSFCFIHKKHDLRLFIIKIKEIDVERFLFFSVDYGIRDLLSIFCMIMGVSFSIAILFIINIVCTNFFLGRARRPLKPRLDTFKIFLIFDRLCVCDHTTFLINKFKYCAYGKSKPVY